MLSRNKTAKQQNAARSVLQTQEKPVNIFLAPHERRHQLPK